MIKKLKPPVAVLLSIALTCCGSCVVKSTDNGTTVEQEPEAEPTTTTSKNKKEAPPPSPDSNTLTFWAANLAVK